MSNSSGPLLAGGAKLTFSWLDGVVLDTSQRSDSYTSGAGRTVVIDGSGGGTTSVNTTVVVSRDIWIRDDAGMEHHVRVNQDVPVRTGQQVAFIYCRGAAAMPGNREHEAGGLMSVYVVSTDKIYTVLSAPSLTKQLVEPPEHMGVAVFHLLLWVFSVLLIAIFGVGLLALAALFTRSFLVRKKRNARSQAILGELKAEHQRLIQAIYSSYKPRLVSADAPVAIGAQTKIAG